MNIPLTRQHLLLAAIGHASRFRLFVLLAERERCVTELATHVGLSQSCTTRHLQVLSAAGVVHAQRDGKRVRVRLRLERPDVAGLLAWARLGALRDAEAGEALDPAAAAASVPAALIAAATPAAPAAKAPRRAKGATRGTRDARPARAARARSVIAAAPAPESAHPSRPISDTTTVPENRVVPQRVHHDLEDFLL